MATYKTSFFFEGFQANPGRTASSVVSWTETWYQTAGTVDQALAFGLSQAPGDFAKKRAGILHALYALKWCRVSNVANPRETKVAAFNPAVGGELGIPPESGGGRLILTTGAMSTAAQINCAVEVDFVVMPIEPTDITHHRRFLLRGLPKSLINGNILNEAGEGWNGLVAFCNFMGRGPAPILNNAALPGRWQMQLIQQPIAKMPITALTINPANSRQIRVTAALGAVPQNKRVTIQGATGIRGLNRIWTCVATTAAPPYALAKSSFNLAGVWDDGTGVVFVNNYQYVAPAQYTLIGLRMKKVGSSPFGRTRGRRRNA